MPPRRLRRALLAGAAVLALGAATGAARPSADTPGLHCGDPRSTEFPITSRLIGGPAAYERGGAPAAWRLELRNTTAGACRDVHPVAVLADRRRALQPGHFHLDFYDTAHSRWQPVRFERTDEAENVGVLESGLAVPGHGTLVVPVRLGFSGDAPEGPVTANVTTVQRRGTDGAWVGESGDYAFTVGAGDRARDGAGGTAAAAPSPRGTPARAPVAGGLADTGDARLMFGLGAVSGVLLVAGAGLLFGGRRLRR
ncbi:MULTISPECIES: hypothetical protein [Streptomyces]|uniref:Gram-positive cocci surface proteins LPxTG domain-containing protein n=1 Tax=Streptomyces luteosporeus TaxID=173856 RepID=A0ABN3TMV3_9ACTN